MKSTSLDYKNRAWVAFCAALAAGRGSGEATVLAVMSLLCWLQYYLLCRQEADIAAAALLDSGRAHK